MDRRQEAERRSGIDGGQDDGGRTGAGERYGDVKMVMVDTRSESDLHTFLKRHVVDEQEAIFTNK